MIDIPGFQDRPDQTLRDNRILLPTLAEVALKTRQVVEQEPELIPAFDKSGLEPVTEVITNEGVDENLQEMQAILC